MGALMDLYRDRRGEIERSISECRDLSEAADHVALQWMALKRDALAGEADRRLKPEIARLMDASRAAAALMKAVCAVEVRVDDARSSRERRVMQWLPAAICQVLAVWMVIIGQWMPALGAMAAAALAAREALAGRAIKPRVDAQPRVDARQMMRQMDLMVETVDVLIERTADELSVAGAPADAPLVTEGVWGAVQMLMEARATGDGDYALRAVPQLKLALGEQGVETIECTPETRQYFEIFPSVGDPVTIRPAMLKDGRLLARGQATEHVT